jgi:hypothetical protein
MSDYKLLSEHASEFARSILYMLENNEPLQIQLGNIIIGSAAIECSDTQLSILKQAARLKSGEENPCKGIILSCQMDLSDVV